MNNEDRLNSASSKIDTYLDVLIASHPDKLSEKVRYKFVGKSRDCGFLRKETDSMTMQEAVEFIYSEVLHSLEDTIWNIVAVDS
jgi:hypothetical protein